jgi:HSP20 family protein
MYFLKVRLGKQNLRGRPKRGIFSLLEYKGPFYMPEGDRWVPEADLYETEAFYVIKVDVAGVKKSHLDLTLHGDTLKVSGQRSLEEMEEGVLRYHRLEMGQGPFERSFQLPQDADLNSIEAVLSDGILTIKIRKRGLEGIDVGS